MLLVFITKKRHTPVMRTLLVTLATPDLSVFFPTWSHHVRRARLDARLYLMDSTRDDARSARQLVSPIGVRRLPPESSSPLGAQAKRWIYVHTLVKAWSNRLKKGAIVVADVDVVWLQHPRAFLRASHAEALELYVSSDAIHPPGRVACRAAAFNVGIMVFFAERPGGRRALDVALDALQTDAGARVDQVAMNEAWRRGMSSASNESGCRILNRAVRLGILPIDSFCNAISVRWCPAPIAVHMVYLRSQTTAAKLLRLRELGWYVGRRYERGLVLPPRPPESVVARLDDDGVPHAHIRLARAQIEHIRRGMTLARIQRLPLVLPRLECACDIGWWRGHVGTSCRAFSWAAVPFQCPLEHLLDPVALDRFNVTVAFSHEVSSFVEASAVAFAQATVDPDSRHVFASWCCSTNAAYDRSGGHIRFLPRDS